MEDVENIITDFMVPTCFIPLKKRKSEPAKPPKLRIIRFGTCFNTPILKDREKDKHKHIAIDIEPPISDFSCIILVIVTPFFKIILLTLLSTAQKNEATTIRALPIMVLSLARLRLSKSTLVINKPIKIKTIPA